MKKEKGFTLIELLAVIIILVIIALISVPLVLNIIEKAKKSAFKDSAYGIIESAKLYYVENIIDNKELGDKVFSYEGEEKELNYSGTKPKGGTVIVKADGTILLALHNGKWCVRKSGIDKITLEDYEEGKCIIEESAKDPAISLQGEAIITISKGSSYEELGAIAKTVDGQELTYEIEIKKGEEVVESIDTSVEGVYIVTYRATSNGKAASIKRTIKIEVSGKTPEEIMNEDPGENGIIVTDTYETKRFAGSNPNNWVCFGDSSITEPSNCDEEHKWRIIGVDKNGQMKIIKNSFYSTDLRWDTSNSNDWTHPATLNTELNGGQFYSNNTYIDETHRAYIINGTWYIGKNASLMASYFISTERSNNWTGYVGLMSVVDFIYAAKSCPTNTDLLSTRYNICMSDNWLVNTSALQWTITSNDGYSNQYVWFVSKNINISYTDANSVGVGVRPAVFLDANVKMKDGLGTESAPYILSK